MKSDAIKAAAAQAWRQAALIEHASVASFARASMELLAVGAPLQLVKRMHEAALDEVRHTLLSFQIAASLDGVEASAGPLPALAPRAATREQVARDTLLEAAIPELVAARQAVVAAERCEDREIAAALRSIGADEARHAELAWDILAWCALNSKLNLPEAPPFASAGRVSELEKWGVLEETTRNAVAYEVWPTVVKRFVG